MTNLTTLTYRHGGQIRKTAFVSHNTANLGSYEFLRAEDGHAYIRSGGEAVRLEDWKPVLQSCDTFFTLGLEKIAKMDREHLLKGLSEKDIAKARLGMIRDETGQELIVANLSYFGEDSTKIRKCNCGNHYLGDAKMCPICLGYLAEDEVSEVSPEFITVEDLMGMFHAQ